MAISYRTCAGYAGFENRYICAVYLNLAVEHRGNAAWPDRHPGILCRFQDERILAPDHGMADKPLWHPACSRVATEFDGRWMDEYEKNIGV